MAFTFFYVGGGGGGNFMYRSCIGVSRVHQRVGAALRYQRPTQQARRSLHGLNARDGPSERDHSSSSEEATEEEDNGTERCLPEGPNILGAGFGKDQATEARMKVSDQVGSERLGIAFTCNKCDTRIQKTFSRHAYYRGIVVIACPTCHVRHLIADNIGWYRDLPGSGSGPRIEEWTDVRRVSADVFELEEKFRKSGEAELDDSNRK